MGLNILLYYGFLCNYFIFRFSLLSCFFFFNYSTCPSLNWSSLYYFTVISVVIVEITCCIFDLLRFLYELALSGQCRGLRILESQVLASWVCVIIVDIVMLTGCVKFTNYYHCPLEFFIYLCFILLCHFLQS